MDDQYLKDMEFNDNSLKVGPRLSLRPSPRHGNTSPRTLEAQETQEAQEEERSRCLTIENPSYSPHIVHTDTVVDPDTSASSDTKQYTTFATKKGLRFLKWCCISLIILLAMIFIHEIVQFENDASTRKDIQNLKEIMNSL